MDAIDALTKPTYPRRTLLAFSAAGVATVALAACGGATPWDTHI